MTTTTTTVTKKVVYWSITIEKSNVWSANWSLMTHRAQDMDYFYTVDSITVDLIVLL